MSESLARALNWRLEVNGDVMHWCVVFFFAVLISDRTEVCLFSLKALIYIFLL